MRINANSGPKLPPSMRNTGRPRTAPSKAMAERHADGATYVQIAAEFGVTMERVGQLVRRERQEAAHHA